ncbi:hypothetical protein [Methanimicrococcus hacksteinii]|uniref:hypothetical protein n=1 Tax=Methanimicrococcus hacksteinii TaxID=3028293 RepID=UPI00298F1AC7|nr:hypothetical protein [Methanimicrococcus sp. At1]
MHLLSAACCGQRFHVHHLIFITSARSASVGADYLPFPFAAVVCDFVNTVADLPACLLPTLPPPRAICTNFENQTKSPFVF